MCPCVFRWLFIHMIVQDLEKEAQSVRDQLRAHGLYVADPEPALPAESPRSRRRKAALQSPRHTSGNSKERASTINPQDDNPAAPVHR